jgi:hypothetical protein
MRFRFVKHSGHAQQRLHIGSPDQPKNGARYGFSNSYALHELLMMIGLKNYPWQSRYQI